MEMGGIKKSTKRVVSIYEAVKKKIESWYAGTQFYAT